MKHFGLRVVYFMSMHLTSICFMGIYLIDVYRLLALDEGLTPVHMATDGGAKLVQMPASITTVTSFHSLPTSPPNPASRSPATASLFSPKKQAANPMVELGVDTGIPATRVLRARKTRKWVIGVGRLGGRRPRW
jgi:hypothetical protein